MKLRCLLSVICLWLAPAAAISAQPPIRLQVHGFTELEAYYNTSGDQSFSEALKKTELRTRVELRVGRDDRYLFMATDLYLQPSFLNGGPNEYRYADEPTTLRNLGISGDRYEWSFNELFLNVTLSPVRLRLGNQLYNWGTADVINPTDYFNPYDFREFFFRDDDEFNLGVPSLSALFPADAVTVETVASFVQIPTRFAPRGNFWSIDTLQDGLLIAFDETDGMDVSWDNLGFAARVTATVSGTDFSFSIYRGPDREPTFVPQKLEVAPGKPITVHVASQYNLIHMIGMDISKAVGDFVFQIEAAYSPDRVSFVEQPLNTLSFPFETKESAFLSYATGFNYFVPLDRLFDSHTGEAVFTLDWFQSHYFDDTLYGASLTDLLTLKFEDNFLDGRLFLSITTMFETRNGGRLYWPKIKYDFQNGFSAELGYAAIDGQYDGQLIAPLFYHFRDNDIIMLRFRYGF